MLFSLSLLLSFLPLFTLIPAPFYSSNSLILFFLLFFFFLFPLWPSLLFVFLLFFFFSFLRVLSSKESERVKRYHFMTKIFSFLSVVLGYWLLGYGYCEGE